MTIRRARGARINGNIIDFTSGWLVANIGHDNRAVRRAIHKAQGWAVMDRHENPHRTAAIKALRSILPSYLKYISLYNSGSEAIDAALRMAGPEVIAHPKAYHGSTIGAQSIERLDFTCCSEPLPSAIMVETFLGPWCEWWTKDDIEDLRAYQMAGGTLIFDEMQSGFGRTGTWWGFPHYFLMPDILVGGKAMAGGLPMAFVASSAWPGDTWESTFSGNALSCAACVATINEIRKRGLIERVQELEPLIQQSLPWGWRGMGFAYAFEHPNADAVCDRALERGLLLLHTGRGTVKICPPLTIRKRDLIRGLEIIKECL